MAVAVVQDTASKRENERNSKRSQVRPQGLANPKNGAPHNIKKNFPSGDTDQKQVESDCRETVLTRLLRLEVLINNVTLDESYSDIQVFSLSFGLLGLDGPLHNEIDEI